MTASKAVKMVLAYAGIKQVDLADQLGMYKQSLGNKMARNSWTAQDLATVADLTGCEIAFVLPDGQKIVIKNDDASAE